MSKNNPSVIDRLELIEARNKRVELDKKWETSWVRRTSIAVLTYIVIVTYLIIIHKEQPFVNGIVPPIGYILSTLVLKRIRDIWQTKKLR